VIEVEKCLVGDLGGVGNSQEVMVEEAFDFYYLST
jgi:hypothetical protein